MVVGMVGVVVVVGSFPVLVPALALLSRAPTLLLGHSYPDFDVLILASGAAGAVSAASSSSFSTSEGETHFQRAPVVPLLLQRDFQDNG